MKIKYIHSLLITIAFLIFGLSASAQQVTTYDEAIIYGDRLYNKTELLNAKAYYQQALKIKPGDEYAKNRITLIVEKMKSAMAAEDEYYDLIDLADELYDKNNLDEAITQYRKALQIIPNDEYALTKVREITTFKNNEKERIESFNKAMEAGRAYITDKDYDNAIASFREAAGIFPEKDAPITELNNANNLKSEYEQRELAFSKKIDEAEKYLLINNYAEALNIYAIADKILPENTEAKKKIAEIKPLADKQNKYNKELEKADEFYISRDFISARKQYLVAGKLWPEKSYPTDMILKIDEKLEEGKKDLENNYNLYIAGGDSLMGLKEYSQAKAQYNMALNLKPDEAYPKSKLLEIDAVFENRRKAFEANYDAMILSADSAFNAELYNIAHDKYETAIEVNPDDEYPQSQIAIIENKMQEIEAEDKLNKEYNDIIAQADKLHNTGNYDLAVKKYREAQALKSIENYPQAKIDAITQMLANAEKQKQIDEKYNELIILAVRQFSQDKLTEARSSYANAVELKPGESMPQQEITKIDSLIVVKAQLAETKKQYDSLVEEGDLLKDQKEYVMAIASYDKAIILIPDNKTAKQRKQTVETIQINIKKEVDRKKSYDDAVAKGDILYEDGSFELARVEFEKARSLRNDEEYPRKRLSDIEKALVRLAAESEKRYNESIVAADNYFQQGNYNDAVIKYQVANSIKPNEKYPQQKIAECNGYIAENLKRLSEEYAIAIADADKLYASKIYDKAIVAYRKAGNTKPDETYPGEMIDKISRYIIENSIVDVIKTSDTVSSGTTEKYEFEPIKINVRKSNYIFLKARNLSGKPVKIIFSYGSDTGKNGGFVVQIIEDEFFNDYIVRVGNQYKWFAEDNNWLTIYPENGDIEITMLRISKGN